MLFSRPRSRKTLLALIILLMFIIHVGGVSSSIRPSQQMASITEWAVPTGRSGPWALTLDQSGECCWFVEYYGSKIAHLDPRTGFLQEWVIPTASSNPYSIAITTASGTMKIWSTEFGSNKVFAFTPQSGTFEEYSLQSGGTGVGYISFEPLSAVTRVWFTETTRNSNGEFIYDPKTENVTFFEDTFPSSVGGGAYGVVAGSDAVWFAGFSALVRWDHTSQQYTLYPLPSHGSAAGRFLAFDARGQLWYTQGATDQSSSDNFVGVLRGNIIQEWNIPVSGANPRGISINPLTQQPWIVEQSMLEKNGSVAYLNDLGNGTLHKITPVTAPSDGTPMVISPTISQAPATTHMVVPATRIVTPSEQGPFAQYGLGPSLPTNAVVDASGNVWVSEPEADKIAKLSVSTADYALSVSSPYVSLAPGVSVPLSVTASSVSGYAGRVSFSSSNLPTGVSLTAFDPNPVDVPLAGNASSNFAVDIAPYAVPGTELLNIQASDGTDSHTIGIIVEITNSTVSTTSGTTLGSRCLVSVPGYLPGSLLLLGLIIDIMIGGFYIGLPLGYFNRKSRFQQGLSRKWWLLVLLLPPSALSAGSALFLLLC